MKQQPYMANTGKENYLHPPSLFVFSDLGVVINHRETPPKVTPFHWGVPWYTAYQTWSSYCWQKYPSWEYSFEAVFNLYEICYFMKLFYFSHVILNLGFLYGNGYQHRHSGSRTLHHGEQSLNLSAVLAPKLVFNAWIKRDLQLAVVGHLFFLQVTHLIEESQNLRRDSPQYGLNLYLGNSAGITEVNSHCS